MTAPGYVCSHAHTCSYRHVAVPGASLYLQNFSGNPQTFAKCLGLTPSTGLVGAACPAHSGQQRPFSARYRSCALVPLLGLGARILPVVRVLRHDRIELAFNQECTAACNLPGNTPCLSLLPSVIVAAHVISVP